MIWIVLIIIITGITFYYISTYNRFQQLKNGADASIGQIKVSLKKRLDTISQLLETVKSYASFEKSTLEKITQLRSSVFKADNPDSIQKIDKETKHILGNILVAVENYPELKTSEIVKELTESIKNIETEISRHRYTYNNIVQEYNTMIDTVPSNIVASLSGFRKKEYLQFEEDVKRRPNLNWSL